MLRKIISPAAALLLACLLSGCESARQYSLTCKLWSDDNLRNFAEPAPDSRLALYEASGREDLLVAYDEGQESSDKIRRRAYFLKPNLGRIAQSQKPAFVDPQTAAFLSPVPPVPGPARSVPESARFVASKNGREFTVLRGGAREGPYQLPVYLQSRNTLLRVGLTPLAVAGDTVMVGVVASVVALFMACQAGAHGSL